MLLIAASAAGFAAMITAGADIIIAADASTVFAVYHFIPSVGMRRKHSHDQNAAEQQTEQPVQFHICFHKQFLLVSARLLAGRFGRMDLFVCSPTRQGELLPFFIILENGAPSGTFISSHHHRPPYKASMTAAR